MFHLFAGLQVVPDITCYGYGKEFIVSKFEDYIVPEGAISIKDQIDDRIATFGSVYASDYDELPYKSDLEFFTTLYKNDKLAVDVYADCQNYAKIVCKFTKLIFPEKDADTAYTEYKLSLDKFYVDYVYNRNTSAHVILYPIEYIRDKFVKLTKAEFADMFAQTVVTGNKKEIEQFRQQVIQELSTEYQIASSLLEDTRFDDELDYQVKNTILRVLASSVQEVNPFATYNIYTKLYNFDNNVEDEIKDGIEKLPIIDLLNNVDLFNPIKTINYDQYNEAFKRLADFLVKCQDFGWDKTDMEYALKCIKYLDRDYPIQDVIVDLLNTHDVKIFLFSEIKNINPLLLFHIFDLYKRNDLKQLAKFAI